MGKQEVEIWLALRKNIPIAKFQKCNLAGLISLANFSYTLWCYAHWHQSLMSNCANLQGALMWTATVWSWKVVSTKLWKCLFTRWLTILKYIFMYSCFYILFKKCKKCSICLKIKVVNSNKMSFFASRGCFLPLWNVRSISRMVYRENNWKLQCWVQLLVGQTWKIGIFF